MMNKTIIQYVNGEMTELERNAFEKKMEADPFLKEAVEGYLLMKANGENIEALINDVGASNPFTTTSKKTSIIQMPIFKIVAIAATVLAILFVTLQVFQKERLLQHDKVFKAYFKPLTNPDGKIRTAEDDSLVDKTTSTQAIEKKAIDFYEKENFKKAIYFYKELVEQDSLNAKHNLFLGISYLANYQTKNAIKTLEKDFATDDFKDDRIWYLALAYIKNNQLDDAKPLLQTLATNDSYYSSNATSILDDITTSTAQKN
ncbi:MAG: hypothetical protein R2801_03315 [Chitinophagales bacterium]